MVFLRDLEPLVEIAEPFGSAEVASAFTDREAREVRSHPDPLSWLGARLAAKFAALGVLDGPRPDPPPWSLLAGVELLPSEVGPPALAVADRGVAGQWLVSLSHDGGRAAALVALRDRPAAR